MKIEIRLAADRTRLGTITLLGDDGMAIVGPVACLGKSDNQYAIDHENPQHDPLKRGGDLPYGTYSIHVDRFGATVSEQDFHSYGRYGKIHLMAIGGDALIACGPIDKETGRGGRDGLCVHGGHMNAAYTRWQGLSPTHGCCRTFEEAMLNLMVELAAHDGTVECEVIPLAA